MALTDSEPPSPLFPQLTALSCESVTASVVSQLPLLHSLTLTRQHDVSVFPLLKPEHMRQLDCELTSKQMHEDLPVLVQAVRRLTQLTHLHLGIEHDTGDAHRYGIPSDVSRELLPLFDSFHGLKHVFLVAYAGIDMDPAIKTLLRQNQALEHLSLRGTFVSQETLRMIGELEHLSCLELGEVGWRFLDEDVLSILRGKSRGRLREIHLDHELLSSAVEEEVDVLAAEAGCIAERTEKWSGFAIIIREPKDEEEWWATTSILLHD